MGLSLQGMPERLVFIVGQDRVPRESEAYKTGLAFVKREEPASTHNQGTLESELCIAVPPMGKDLAWGAGEGQEAEQGERPRAKAVTRVLNM